VGSITLCVGSFSLCGMLASLAASILDSVPGLFFGLPVLVAASVVFAATHHEDPEEIQAATIHWLVWLGVILLVVLAVVMALGWR
jgi:phosphatidylserine synthase